MLLALLAKNFRNFHYFDSPSMSHHTLAKPSESLWEWLLPSA